MPVRAPSEIHSPPTPGAPPAGQLTAHQAAAEALEGFHWLLERASIYPEGHPVVDASRERAAGLFERAFERSAAIQVRASRGSLRIDPEPDSVDSLRCRSLGTFLVRLDILGVEFRRGVEPDAILSFARQLGTLRATGGPGAAREAFQSGRPYPGIRVLVLDYNAIRVDSGTYDEAVGENPERIAAALTETILGPPDSPRTLAPEQLAELLGDEIQRLEGVGAGVLSRQLQKLLADIHHLPPESRWDAQVRISRFLTAVPGSLREELLRIDTSVASSPGDLEPLRPDAIITTLLCGTVQGGERPPEDAIALLTQLLRTSGAGSDSEALVSRVAEGEAGTEELEELTEAIEELFHNRENLHANPEDYQALIDSLARSGPGVAAASVTWRDRYDDPADWQGRHAHAVEIATAQLDVAGAEDYLKGTLAFLERSTSSLLKSRRFDVLADAVDAVDAWSRREETGAEPRIAAHRYVEAVLEEDTLVSVLNAAPHEEPVPEPVRRLLRRSGSAVDAIVRVLGSGVPAVFAEPLHEILAERPVAKLLAIAASRVEGGWPSLRPLFPVLRRLDTDAVQEFLVDLFRHPDEKVRAHALDALADRSLAGGGLGKVFESLLQDASPRIVRAVIRKLGAMPEEEAADLLGRLVRGRVAKWTAPAALDIRLLAVRVLTLRGELGWKRLLSCIATLSWRLRPDHVRVARVIAAAVERRYEPGEAARLLQVWRLSPARWLGVLVCRDDDGEAVHW